MAFADVFLPASMSCERNTQRVWWVPLRGMKKVTQFADVRSDDTIVTDLGRRLHPENFPWTDDIGWTNDILVNDTPGYDGDFEQLCKDAVSYTHLDVYKRQGCFRDVQPLGQLDELVEGADIQSRLAPCYNHRGQRCVFRSMRFPFPPLALSLIHI